MLVVRLLVLSEMMLLDCLEENNLESLVRGDVRGEWKTAGSRHEMC